MAVDPQTYQRIKEVVIQALESDLGEREAVVARLCDGDAELRREVEALLAQDVGTVFMEESPTSLILSDEPEADLVGKVGRISIKKLIARGGMGEVYEGVDDLLGRPVAIKIINSHMRLSHSRRSAFLSEAKILSNLAHPNICQVYDFFEDEQRDVLVMELVEGRTLRDLIDSREVENALGLLIQITQALTEAHERGIAHHDLKPENIMVDKNGQTKILDFGLADFDQESSSRDPDQGSKLISGTPIYMSPERARGEPSSTASDLWSLGLLTIELMSAESWYPREATSAEVLDLAKAADVNLPKKLAGDETALVKQLLNPTANLRPTARETLSAFERIKRRPRRRLMQAVAATVIVVAALSGWKYTTDLQVQRNLAISAEQRAETARLEAEGLVGYMLDELNEELAALGRLSLMESTARKALEYYQGLSAEQLKASQGSAAMAMMQVAEVIERQGDLEEAVALLQPANDALNELYQDDPNSNLLAFRLGLLNFYMSEVTMLAGNFDQSLQHSQLGIKLGRQLTQGLEPGTAPQGEPTATKRWKVLLRSLYRQGDALMRKGEGLKGVPILEEAAQIAEAAVKVEPKMTKYLADIQFKRCDIYYELDLGTQMLAPCIASYELDERQHLNNPDDVVIREFFGTTHMTLARVYNSLQQYDKAAAVASAGKAHFDLLIEWEPGNMSIKNDLAGLLIAEGVAHKELNNQQQGRALFEQADALLKPISKDREETNFLNNQFATAVYLGQIDEAEELAEILLERGFRRRIFTQLCHSQGFAVCSNFADPGSDAGVD